MCIFFGTIIPKCLKSPHIGLRKSNCYFFFAMFHACMIAEDEVIKEFSSALQTWLTIISISLEIFATI